MTKRLLLSVLVLFMFLVAPVAAYTTDFKTTDTTIKTTDTTIVVLDDTIEISSSPGDIVEIPIDARLSHLIPWFWV